MTNYIHVMKFKVSLLFTIIFLGLNISIGTAQLQTDFGKRLIQEKIESPKATEPELLIDYQVSNVFNDHIEFWSEYRPEHQQLGGARKSPAFRID